jgi:drug/metabolite transporter (DMT)-like permease
MSGQSPQRSLAAVALIVSAAACFTVIDTIVKYLGTRYSVPLIVLARWGVPALLMIVFLGPKLGWGLLRTAKLRLHVARAGVLILATLSFFTALKFLPLAEATGLNYSTPTLVMVMAAWFLRERNTLSRWMFVIAGCVGILLIVRPGYAMLHVASLFALGAAALNATFQILTRRLAGENLIVMIFYPSVVGAVLMLLTIPFVDHDASYLTSDILLLVAIGGIGGLGHCLLVQAFRRATASAIAPFMYVQLILSTLAGWLTFDTFPDRWALAGITVIAASAVILTWNENRRAAFSSDAGSALASQQSAMIFTVPGAGATAVEFTGDRSRHESSILHLRVGESAEFHMSGGTRKTVLRTD